MSDYVSFECVHIAEANQNDPDERRALAYADIDGYPADENAEGTVICRVWLMREKEGGYPTYLVNWYHDSYRKNELVLELIRQAKKDLNNFFKDTMVEKVFERAYNRYKLQWMIDNGHTFKELLDELQAQMMKSLLPAETIKEAFSYFENSLGFDGDHLDIWDCEESFRETEWKDDTYMRKLLTSSEYGIWCCK